MICLSCRLMNCLSSSDVISEVTCNPTILLFFMSFLIAYLGNLLSISSYYNNLLVFHLYVVAVY